MTAPVITAAPARTYQFHPDNALLGAATMAPAPVPPIAAAPSPVPPQNALAAALQPTPSPAQPAAISTPPRPPQVSPMLAHVHATAQGLATKSDDELRRVAGHNASAQIAFRTAASKADLVYADAFKVFADLVGRGALPGPAAFQAASQLPTDPKRLREVVRNLQAFTAHTGVEIHTERQRRRHA